METDSLLLAAVRDLLEQRRFDDALTLVDDHLGQHPTSSAALWLSAMCLVGLGRNEEAVYRARRIAPDSPFAAHGLRAESVALTKLGRGDEAMAVIDEANRLTPDDVPNAHLNLAVIHLQRGDADAAVAEAERAVADNRRSAHAAFILASAQSMAGHGWAARAWLRRALKLDPEHPQALAMQSRLRLVFRFGAKARAAREGRAQWAMNAQAGHGPGTSPGAD